MSTKSEFVEKAMIFAEEASDHAADQWPGLSRGCLEELRARLQQREEKAQKLAEALRDFLDGKGDMTAERVTSYRTALAEWEGK